MKCAAGGSSAVGETEAGPHGHGCTVSHSWHRLGHHVCEGGCTGGRSRRPLGVRGTGQLCPGRAGGGGCPECGGGVAGEAVPWRRAASRSLLTTLFLPQEAAPTPHFLREVSLTALAYRSPDLLRAGLRSFPACWHRSPYSLASSRALAYGAHPLARCPPLPVF